MDMRRKSRELVQNIGGRSLDRLLVDGKATVMPEQACVVIKTPKMCVNITRDELDEVFMDYCEGYLQIGKLAAYRAMTYLKQLKRL